MRPSMGSTPPQKDKGSESTSAGPWALPGTSARPLEAGPEVALTPHLSFCRGADALSEAPERYVHAEGAGRVVRPLRGVRHHYTVPRLPEDGSDVRARIDDDPHARPLAVVRPSARLSLGKHTASRGHVELDALRDPNPIEELDE